MTSNPYVCCSTSTFVDLVAVDALRAQFATVAAGFDAAERREGVHGVALVDPQSAGADAPGDRQGPVGVGGPHRTGQAVVRVVGNGNRIVLVTIGNDGDHGTEYLFARNAHGVVGGREEGGPHVPSALKAVGHAGAADDKAG